MLKFKYEDNTALDSSHEEATGSQVQKKKKMKEEKVPFSPPFHTAVQSQREVGREYLVTHQFR